MQKISGHGLAFLEFDGSVIEYVLQPGQQIVVDSYLAAMEATWQYGDSHSARNQKHLLFGGEGLFNTVITDGTGMASDNADFKCGRRYHESFPGKINIIACYIIKQQSGRIDIDTDPARLLKEIFADRIARHV